MFPFKKMNREIASRLKHTVEWIFWTCIISFSATLVIFVIERGTNPFMDSLWELVWWWINTITGIGGTYDPLTKEGQILGIFVIITGIVLLAIAIAEVADLIRLTYERRDKGMIHINYTGHIIIYGYTSLTAGVVKLLRHHFGRSLKIVLISNDTSFNPFPKEVDFIYANPIDRTTFEEANAKDCLASIILANDRFSDPDAYSLVIASGVEKHNSKSVTIVELMDDAYRELYKEGNIEAFIKRKELLTDLLRKNTDSKLLRIIEKETVLNPDDGDEDKEKVELI